MVQVIESSTKVKEEMTTKRWNSSETASTSKGSDDNIDSFNSTDSDSKNTTSNSTDDDFDIKTISNITDNDNIRKQAESLYQDEKILDAYRVLQKLLDKENVFKNHANIQHIWNIAKECEIAIADMVTEDLNGWTKHGESHGKYDTDIYYKLDHNTGNLTCRVETPIDENLLIPLLCVMNESTLYKEWIPTFKIPKIQVRDTKQLAILGKRGANQIIQVIGDIPWPFTAREVVLNTIVVDDIDTNGYLAVRLHSINENEHPSVPPVKSNIQRIQFEGALLIHPYISTTTTTTKTTSTESNKVLVSFKMWCDPRMKGIPTNFINFVTKTLIGRLWGMLLQVAEDVRDNKRPNHLNAIQKRSDFYKYVQERITCLINKEVSSDSTTTSTTTTNSYDEQKKFINYLQS